MSKHRGIYTLIILPSIFSTWSPFRFSWQVSAECCHFSDSTWQIFVSWGSFQQFLGLLPYLLRQLFKRFGDCRHVWRTFDAFLLWLGLWYVSKLDASIFFWQVSARSCQLSFRSWHPFVILGNILQYLDPFLLLLRQDLTFFGISRHKRNDFPSWTIRLAS